MSVRSFFDTNVLVYTDDADARPKRERSLDLLMQHRRGRVAVLSTQVLQEYFVASTRKLGVSVELARRKVALFAQFEVVRIDSAMIVAAIDLHRLHGFAFWDALIIRSALQAGCAVLYSEDLQPGRTVEGLSIVNPFAAAGGAA